MDYIVNQDQERIKIVMFEHDGRNWEICFEPNKTEEEIQHLIYTRIDGLTNDILLNGDYDKSDLYVDYIDYEKNNNI